MDGFTFFLPVFGFHRAVGNFYYNRSCARHVFREYIMKCRYLLIAMAVTMLFSSCTVSEKMVQSSPVVARNVKLDPIKADIVVNQDQKLVGQGTTRYIFGIEVDNLLEEKTVDGVIYSQKYPIPISILLDRGKAKARAIAAYRALEACPDCDVLVHPKYEVIINKSPLGIIYRKYTVIVSGYGAKYTNFRTEKEIKIIGNQNKEYIVVDDE